MSGKIYRTGDLVELLPDGSINFIGRIDNQVKIRGFRIELSEIDSVILSYPNIKESVTIVNDVGTNKYICSYVATDTDISFDDLKIFLKEHLPIYMIPSYFVRLDKLPLNINGKIEKKKLPPIDLSKTEKKIILPKNDIQFEILSYLKTITKKEIISIEDNFIDDLNLDSLNSMELATKLYKYDVSIQDVANFPTIEKLAEKIETKTKNNCFNNHYEDVCIINNSKPFDISNVLLTGVTGFLGIHILKELLESSKVNKVFCLIRKKNNLTSIQRLEDTFKFYYPFENFEKYINKIIVLDGDFTYKKFNLSKEDYNKAKSCVTCVIHCGAKVKHYGKYEEFYNANVIGTKNIIQFCTDSNASFAYISTVSVGGLSIISDNIVMDENSININQEFKDQVYMYTKYLAECEVLKEIKNDNLNAKIFRLDNIMPRISDGLFQKNKQDNAFLCKVRTIVEVCQITPYLNSYEVDLSPVDLCAKSILLLLTCDSKQLIYHIYNSNQINFGKIFEYANIPLKTVNTEDLTKSTLKLDNIFNLHLLNELKYENYRETRTTNTITTKILNSLGFSWNIISEEYVKKLIGDVNYEEF